LRKVVGLPALSLEQAHPQAAAAIQFRKNMAHGRTERHKLCCIIDSESHDKHDNPVGWQTDLDMPIVRARLEARQELIKELHSAAGLGKTSIFYTIKLGDV